MISKIKEFASENKLLSNKINELEVQFFFIVYFKGEFLETFTTFFNLKMKTYIYKFFKFYLLITKN